MGCNKKGVLSFQGSKPEDKKDLAEPLQSLLQQILMTFLEGV